MPTIIGGGTSPFERFVFLYAATGRRAFTAKTINAYFVIFINLYTSRAREVLCVRAGKRVVMA